jgi:hypothetical protein
MIDKDHPERNIEVHVSPRHLTDESLHSYSRALNEEIARRALEERRTLKEIPDERWDEIPFVETGFVSGLKKFHDTGARLFDVNDRYWLVTKTGRVKVFSQFDRRWYSALKNVPTQIQAIL